MRSAEILIGVALSATLATPISTQSSPVVLKRFDGDSLQVEVGRAVCALGDIDGDLVPDFAISGVDLVGPLRTERLGWVQLISGATRSVIRTHYSPDHDDEFGQRIAGGGDLNGDGRGDVVIAAPLAAIGGVRRGTVRAFSGRDGRLIHAWNGPIDRGQFGYFVRVIGDFDGDGHADVGIGGNPTYIPDVVVFSGSDGTPIPASTGLPATGGIGTRLLSGLGDINADGFDEIAADQGAAIVVHSQRPIGLARIWHTWPPGQHRLGLTLMVGPGDLDGDRVPDVVAGNDSSIHAWSCSNASLLYEIFPPSGQRFVHLSTAGDVDGDGVTDFLTTVDGGQCAGITTSSSSVQLHSGVDGSKMLALGCGNSHYGAATSTAGDVTGDALPEVLVGDPYVASNPTIGGSVFLFELGYAATPGTMTFYGRGCPGTDGRLPRIGFAGVPKIGTTLDLTLAAAPAATVAALTPGFGLLHPGGMNLGSIGMIPCFLYVNPTGSVHFTTNANGHATGQLTIALNQSLVGARWHFQWIVLDPGAPYALPVTLSRALLVEFGL